MNINISGPYFKCCHTSLTRTTLHRDEWFVSRPLKPNEASSPILKMIGNKPLGCILKFKNRKTYVIDQLYPHTAFKSLKKAVEFLVKNDGKLVFCT